MNIENFFLENNGYARMKDLKFAWFHTRTVAKAVSCGIIEKIKHGLYKLTDYQWDEYNSFVDIYS